MDDDVIAMQEMLAHQQMEIARLSDELYTQQKELLLLQKQMRAVIGKVSDAEARQSPDGMPQDEPPPPHY